MILPNGDFFPLEMRLHPGYARRPWRFDYRAVGGHVSISGAGLTALDVVGTLKAPGRCGAAHVPSRNGRYPNLELRLKERGGLVR